MSPDAAELDGDAVDNDCDGYTDEVGDADVDDDGDGFTEVEGDCGDGDAAVSPAELERSDGIDNNCDGSIDEPDGLYEGELTITVSGDLEDSCTGGLYADVDQGLAPVIYGEGDCAAGLFESVLLTGGLSDVDASGSVQALLVGSFSVDVAWTGSIELDTLSGSFSGSESDGALSVDYTGTFTLSR